MGDFSKIIIRQGIESDRESVIYSSGEPLYITNSKRTFVGDGVTSGGILASNKFLGFATFNLNSGSTGITYAYGGDIVFDKTTDNLYALTGSAPSSVTSYSKITRNFTADNITTELTQISAISVKGLSLNSDYFAPTIYGRSLEKNGVQIRLSTPETNGGLEFGINDKLQIKNRSVTNAMLEGMIGNTVKGNLGIAGDVEDIPLATLASVIAPLLVGVNTNFGVPIGTIIDFGGITSPTGYLKCDGSTILVADYPDLYAAIGNTWGGNSTSFNLPDMRRRVVVGSEGTETTVLSSYVGATGGFENTILLKENIPSHIHTYDAVSSGGTSSLNTTGGTLNIGSYLTGNGTSDGLNVGPLGRPFSNIQPSAVVLKCIKAF